jgi:hypothetical protein
MREPDEKPSYRGSELETNFGKNKFRLQITFQTNINQGSQARMRYYSTDEEESVSGTFKAVRYLQYQYHPHHGYGTSVTDIR